LDAPIFLPNRAIILTNDTSSGGGVMTDARLGLLGDRLVASERIHLKERIVMADLIKSFFEPKTAAAILIALGVFTALYTAAIKFFAQA